MKLFYLVCGLGMCSFFLPAQDTLSFFDWETTDPLQATIGPNAVSVGANAFTGARGDGRGNGLGAPTTTTGKSDLVFTLADDARYDVAGLDLSVIFRREESAYTIFRRGNFVLGNAGFNVTYQVTEADGSCSAAISSPTFTIPDDNSYHRYRFRYDPTTGIAQLFEDGDVEWRNTDDGSAPTPEQPLCWTGAGDIVVGVGMDGSGSGDVLLDSLLLQDVKLTPPPPEDVILYFDWEQGDPLVSAIGPDAISVGAGVVTKARLDGNGQGLAAPVTADPSVEQNIDLVVADDPIFNVPGIDLSYTFQSNEGEYTVFSRGAFSFGRDGHNVSYRVTEPDGSCSAPITSTTAIAPQDDTYRTYRFRYDPNAGTAVLSVDGLTTWTNEEAGGATPGQALCWTGDTDIVVGTLLDGNDTGNATLDNLRLEGIALNAGLPIRLQDFTAQVIGRHVLLRWQTATETANDYFHIERSDDRSTGWTSVGVQAGQGTTTAAHAYTLVDEAPLPGRSYYRLQQVDYDGSTTYSDIVTVVRTAAEVGGPVAVYPNPTLGPLTLLGAVGGKQAVSVRDVRGRRLTVPVRSTAGAAYLDLTGLSAGVYTIRYGGAYHRVVKY